MNTRSILRATTFALACAFAPAIGACGSSAPSDSTATTAEAVVVVKCPAWETLVCGENAKGMPVCGCSLDLLSDVTTAPSTTASDTSCTASLEDVPSALSASGCTTGIAYRDTPQDNPLGIWACASYTATAGFTVIGPGGPAYSSRCVGQPDSGFVMVTAPVAPPGYNIDNMPAGGPCHQPPPP
ncbi:MAG TPA: hypothetical protein VIF15_07455 [Polyangiaceae bacterium]|jgi:hypothetical protein